jgi:uncharacterized integral membrane protein
MNHDQQPNISQQLLEQDKSQSEGDSKAANIHFNAVMKREQEHEKLIKRIALISWTVTAVALIIILLSATFIMANINQGTSLNLARSVLVIFSGIGILSLFVAIVTFFRLMIRPRNLSLIAIEHRLLALEELITKKYN